MRAPDCATGLTPPIDDEANAPTDVIRPKLVLPMVVVGLPNTGVFVKFWAVAWSCKLKRSLILNRLITSTFKFLKPGP